MSNESSESKKKRGPRWPRILVGLVVFLALLLAVVQYALGPIVRTTAEKLGPSVLGTRVDVTNAHMRVLSGLVRMEGVVVGPPEGFDANVFEMQNFRVDLDTASLFGGADEPILIRDITIEGPFVTYELKGIRDNLHKLLSNLGADDDGEEKPEEQKEEPCIRCGSCVLSCPAHLQPKLIMDAMKSMPVDKELIKSLHPLSCVECGLCTYVCTSKIRVTDYVRRAKIVAKLP